MEDSEVVAAIAAGDPAGLAGAYDTYAAPLYAYCRWMLREPAFAADALLDTFVTAGARLGGLKDASQLRAWLYAAARDECCRRLRTAGAAFDETADEAGQPAVAGERAEHAEVRNLIRATLAELEPAEHEVIELSIRCSKCRGAGRTPWRHGPVTTWKKPSVRCSSRARDGRPARSLAQC